MLVNIVTSAAANETWLFCCVKARRKLYWKGRGSQAPLNKRAGQSRPLDELPKRQESIWVSRPSASLRVCFDSAQHPEPIEGILSLSNVSFP